MLRALPGGRAHEQQEAAADKLACLMALEQKALWLSTWMIHHANHIRPSRDGLKVGGHQASSASVATLMTALYLDVMRPQDRVAVKPHAAPLFHALQYLLGQQSRDKLERFRALGGAQAYPSRSKDGDIVDFSTGSVGLRAGVTLFASPDGEQLREWIDACPNSLYSALVYKGGEGWREHLRRDLNRYPGIRAILDDHDDEALARLMTNLAGHDMGSVLDAFHAVTDDQPTCFIAYTIKGYGLPFAGHKDNHAGLMNPQQMASFQQSMGVPAGAEWERFAGLDLPPEELEAFVAEVPLAAKSARRHRPPPLAVPAEIAAPRGRNLSTQEAFGRILGSLATAENALAGRIVTTSPDVTVSTNLGAWVNRRGIFDRAERADTFREEQVVSAQRWAMSPKGQHIELGIAENNLFLQLAALGLAGPLFGTRLLPIGTLYDPFIKRGLDVLNYACYQDARFILVATPSWITLAPEGGAHHSIVDPLIGFAQPGLVSFEPAYADELAVLQ